MQLAIGICAHAQSNASVSALVHTKEDACLEQHSVLVRAESSTTSALAGLPLFVMRGRESDES